MRYMLINLSDNSIVKTMDGGIDPDAQTKQGYKWLPCPFVTKPDFNSEIETVEGPTYTVEKDQVIESWNKRLLSDAELSEAKRAKVNAIPSAQLQLMYDLTNKVKTLEGAPEISLEEFKTSVEKFV